MNIELIPQSLLDVWLIAFRECDDRLKSVQVLATAAAWKRLADGSGFDSDTASRLAGEGRASVQIFPEHHTGDTSDVCEFVIVDRPGDRLLIVARE